MSRAKRSTPPQVYKFGGASLGDGAAFLHAATIAKGCRGPLAVVCSAPAGATDLLLETAEKARRGDATKMAAAVRALRDKYATILQSLGLAAAVRQELAAEIEASMA